MKTPRPDWRPKEVHLTPVTYEVELPDGQRIFHSSRRELTHCVIARYLAYGWTVIAWTMSEAAAETKAKKVTDTDPDLVRIVPCTSPHQLKES